MSRSILYLEGLEFGTDTPALDSFHVYYILLSVRTNTGDRQRYTEHPKTLKDLNYDGVV